MPEPTADPPEAEAAQQRAVRGFRRLGLIVLASFGVLLAVAAGTMFALYQSATATVPEYEAVVEINAAEAEEQRKAFESQLAALASDSQNLEQWSSRVTAAQINAWLAIRLEQDFPGFQKAGLLSPRVILNEGQIVVAALSTATRVQGVVSIAAAPRLTPHDELALEIEWAKIGTLPLPLDALFAQLRETPLGDLGPIRLAQSGESAAVVIDLDRIDFGAEKTMGLIGVDVRPGELLLRGETLAVE